MGGGLPSLPAYQPQNEPPPKTGKRVRATVLPSNVISIDRATGQTHSQNPDGSLTISPLKNSGTRETVNRRNFDANLADDPEVPGATIAQRLLEGINADIKSRREWEDTANRGRELLGVTLTEANGEISASGTLADTKNLAYLDAIIRSWANSRAELLPSNGPVKVSDDMPALARPPDAPAPPPPQPAPPPQPGQPPAPPPPPQQPNALRSDLADMLEKDMNHYLTVVDKDYVPDVSRMLLNRAINGVQFREVYRDPLLRRPVSRWIKGEDLIVSNDAAHISGAGRVTKRSRQRQSVVKRLQAIGHWSKIGLAMPSPDPSPTERTVSQIEGVQASPPLPEDVTHTIYECYCELDNGPLGDDEKGRNVGFPLPYRVTIDKDSQKVLEIRRNWKQGDIDYRARRRFVKYGFVPGLGFYDWGYVHILGNPQRATSAIECMLIDSGMFASFPGGLMAKGPGASRNRTTQIRPRPGEFAVIDTGGLPIEQVAMPLPYKEPSAVLQNQGIAISTDMRKLAGVLELPVGEGRIGNTPVGTIMAYVDSITKVPSAIHKDDHAAQLEEFELLKELFIEEPEALTAGMRRPARADGYTEEELRDQEIVPRSDPNTPSQLHRIMQAQALVEASAMPQFAGIANPRAIWERSVRTLGVERTDDVTLPPQAPQPPPPPPQVIAAQIRDQTAKTTAQASLQKTEMEQETKRMELAQRGQTEAGDRISEEKRAGLKLLGETAKAKAQLAGQVGNLAVDLHKHHTVLDQKNLHKAADLADAERQRQADVQQSQQDAMNASNQSGDEEPT